MTPPSPDPSSPKPKSAPAVKKAPPGKTFEPAPPNRDIALRIGFLIGAVVVTFGLLIFVTQLAPALARFLVPLMPNYEYPVKRKVPRPVQFPPTGTTAPTPYLPKKLHLEGSATPPPALPEQPVAQPTP